MPMWTLSVNTYGVLHTYIGMHTVCNYFRIFRGGVFPNRETQALENKLKYTEIATKGSILDTHENTYIKVVREKKHM